MEQMMIWLVNPNYDFPPHPTDRSQAKKSGSNQGLFEGEGHGQIETHREKIVNVAYITGLLPLELREC